MCCGQSPHRPIVGVAHLQGKSSLTGDASGGDPPTVKSERRLGNSKKLGAQWGRARERARELKSLKALQRAYQDCCLILFYSRMRYGPAINGADNWRVVKSLEAVKLPWAIKSSWIVRINPCPWQDNASGRSHSMSLTGQWPIAVVRHLDGLADYTSVFDCRDVG